MPFAIAYIVTALLAVASAALIGFWGAVHYQLIRTSRRVPTARAGIALARQLGIGASAGNPPTGLPSICVIVPAHNESAVIGSLVESLRQQDYPNLSFVFALDRCTDDTRKVIETAAAGDPRFHIHEITHCPPDWAGKVHALWTAVSTVPAASSADILLFADADTTFSPSCVSATLALMRHRELGLLSLLSTLSHSTWYELVVQPAAAFELVHQYPLVQANRDRPRRPFANGQFIMITAGAYRTIGGHQAVKDELLEDLAIARLATDNNIRSGVFLADGVMHCRMYPDWSAFRRGWKRIFTEAGQRKVARLRKSARILRLTGAVAPIAAIILTIAWAILSFPLPQPEDIWPAYPAGIAFLTWLSALLCTYRTGHTPVWAIFGNPIGAWMVAGILDEAARDLESGVPTVWGGRVYARPVR